MASTPRRKGQPSGVRGPRGPQGGAPRASGSGSGAASPRQPGRRLTARERFEELSFPFLRTISALPRWLVVVLPAALLVAGLVLSGPWAWLGGIFLLIDFLLLAWLTALSWPAIGPGSRFVRVIVVAALLGITILKFAGRF